MTELKPCIKCGSEVVGHVNYYELNKFKFEIECSRCNYTWLSKCYESLMDANHNGAKSWNNMPRKKRKSMR